MRGWWSRPVVLLALLSSVLGGIPPTASPPLHNAGPPLPAVAGPAAPPATPAKPVPVNPPPVPHPAPPPPSLPAHASPTPPPDLHQLPLAFVPNQGQSAGAAR